MNDNIKFFLDTFNVEEFIKFVNDNIDTTRYKYGEIEKIDNIEYWDNLGEYLGGYMLMDILTKNPMPKGAKYVMFDSELNRIYWIRNRRDIIDIVGANNIADWYNYSLD